jgi:hypothetical protein
LFSDDVVSNTRQVDVEGLIFLIPTDQVLALVFRAKISFFGPVFVFRTFRLSVVLSPESLAVIGRDASSFLSFVGFRRADTLPGTRVIRRSAHKFWVEARNRAVVILSEYKVITSSWWRAISYPGPLFTFRTPLGYNYLAFSTLNSQDTLTRIFVPNVTVIDITITTVIPCRIAVFSADIVSLFIEYLTVN